MWTKKSKARQEERYIDDAHHHCPSNAVERRIDAERNKTSISLPKLTVTAELDSYCCVGPATMPTIAIAVEKVRSIFYAVQRWNKKSVWE